MLKARVTGLKTSGTLSTTEELLTEDSGTELSSLEELELGLGAVELELGLGAAELELGLEEVELELGLEEELELELGLEEVEPLPEEEEEEEEPSSFSQRAVKTMEPSSVVLSKVPG